MSVSKHVLRADQDAAVWMVLAEPTKAALIAAEMGFGKTTLAAEIVVRGGFARTLTVGVKDTFAQWADRLEAQSDGAIVLRRLDATKAGRANFAAFIAGEPGHFFSGSQYLAAQDWTHDLQVLHNGEPMLDEKTGKQTTTRRQLKTYAKMRPLDALIVDEVHVFSNKRAVGLRTLRTIKSEWKIGMSGTPYGNKFIGIWAITRWLWSDLIDGSHYRWIAEWCVTEDTYIKGGTKVSSVTGEVEPGKFVASLPCYVRAESTEQAPAAKVVMVDLAPEQRQDYEALEADMLVWIQSHKGLAPLVAELPITLRSRLRTATLGVMSFDQQYDIFFDMNTKSSKLHALRGVLDHWGNQPVVIYTDSKRFAKVVVARMQAAGYNAVEWSGDVSSKQRDEIKRAFLAKEVQYIVAVITAFSTGLDGFQSVCNKIVWLSQSENGIQNEQATARIFRPGRTEANGGFEQVKILARGTLDEGIYNRKIMEALAMNATLRHEKVAA